MTLHGHVVVVGMPAAGKSTLGRALADELGVPYVDNDAAIETARGRTGREIVEGSSVGRLHDLEASTLLRQLDRSTSSVISAAASVVDSAPCRAALAERATVCWIDVAVDELVRRIGDEGHRRPMERAELERLAVQRRPHFEELSDVRIDGSLSPRDQVALVLDRLGVR